LHVQTVSESTLALPPAAKADSEAFFGSIGSEKDITTCPPFAKTSMLATSATIRSVILPSCIFSGAELPRAVSFRSFAL